MSFHPVLRLLIASIAVALAAAACGDGGGGSATTPGPGEPTRSATSRSSSGSGSLVITDIKGLLEHDVKSGSREMLLTPETPDTFLLDPAISPDGKRLVYIVQPPPRIIDTCAGGKPTPTPAGEGRPSSGCGVYDAGSDIWVANRDGSDPHVVFPHSQPNQLIRFPQWQDNDNILAVVQEIGPVNGIAMVSYVLERIPVAGGEPTRMIENVLSFGLSPDGKQVAYARLAPAGGETLNVADINGDNDRILVPASENLSPFNAVRYSPDGTKIAFASADQTGVRAQSPEYVSAAAAGPMPAPPVDGLPEDIWTVDVAGGRPARVADLKEDLPTLTWSGDGKHIYVVGAAGLYDVSLETGAVDRLAEGTFHGAVVWVP